MKKPLISVSVVKMNESKGPSWWVTLTNSVYQTTHPMMTQVRDDALTEAKDWADFFGLPLTPYFEDGVEIKPEFTLDTFVDD